MDYVYKKEYMDLAVKTAVRGIESKCGGPFGCVIVKNGEIVAAAHNTVVRDNDPTAHGEVNAIRQACKKLGTFNLNGCELYTTSEPCPMCLSAIMWSRIERVYSAMNIDDAKEIGFDDKPFYEAIPDYAKNGECSFLKAEFHREKEAEELFDEYSKMEKTPY